MKRLLLALALVAGLTPVSAQTRDWVTTWATALQIAEPHNRPPQPGLAGNSFRQIVQVSIGGKALRLHLSNLFNADPTDILGVEVAVAKTMGESPEIVEGTSVKLSFDGCPFVTMAPGTSVVSDPVAFPLEDRMNLAITIHYGRISSTLLTSHPGSRTTSYIADGYTTDFSKPIAETNHWYTISSIDVKPRRRSAAIAVLGDSITDGRGTTTNGQDRWTDQLSRSLLTDRATRNLSVLNFGLGGNCILRGGLGPTGQSRYVRDLFGHPGVKYVILFEGTNDLGGSRNGKATAEGIKEVWTKIVQEAHALGIKVFGATVTPVKGNGYYSPDHEAGRVALNEWIRTSGVFDGVIDFDRMVADPANPDAKGYEKMGWGIDRGLFR